MQPGVKLPRDIQLAIVAHSANCEPNECCGLIAFDASGRIRFAYPLTNADQSPASFTIDPDESVHAFLHAEACGWEVRGVFHSHPNGPDSLSGRDLAEAPPGWVHLLATPSGLRAYRVSDGVAAEITVAHYT